jgi:PelA/Pel-15E family pectate lyase
LDKPDEWFASDEGKELTANILSFQAELGGWPKNIDTVSHPYPGDKKDLEPTFDNSATTDELRFLAHAYRATKNEQHLQAFQRGLDYILSAQYKNGGWPQSFPPGKGYPRFITFNDDAMVRVLLFVRSVARDDLYDFLPAERRAACQTAFDRAIPCILKCQIRIDGKPTVWCAQHDEVDFRPQHARTYELPSFSGQESVGIVRLLMSLDQPSPEVTASVEGAIAWFEKSKLTGIRQKYERDPLGRRGWNKIVVADTEAKPLWARFYDLEECRPMYVDRDGIPKRDIAEIGYERRNGYSWLTERPRVLLEVEYPAWKQRVKR